MPSKNKTTTYRRGNFFFLFSTNFILQPQVSQLAQLRPTPQRKKKKNLSTKSVQKAQNHLFASK
jgi:hypothetical protein